LGSAAFAVPLTARMPRRADADRCATGRLAIGPVGMDGTYPGRSLV